MQPRWYWCPQLRVAEPVDAAMASKQMLQSISLMDYSIGSDLGLVGVGDFNFFRFQPDADIFVSLEGAYLLLGEQTGTRVLILF